MGAALLGVTYVISTTTGLTVNVAPNGEVSVTFGRPFGGGDANTFVAPFGGPPADLPAVIRAVVDAQHTAEQQYYLVLSVLAVVILSLASVLIGWFVVGRVLRPLRTMTHAAREISSSNLGLRIAPHGPDDELRDLGETFDDSSAGSSGRSRRNDSSWPMPPTSSGRHSRGSAPWSSTP